ncbi:MAG: hypothetical protein KAZ87_04520 [Spirochaetes bacterium]|nr:hypothetical protein [Spirochaetota bacterium]
MKSERIIFQIILSGIFVMSISCGGEGGGNGENYDPNSFDSAEEVKDKVSVKVGDQTFNMIYVNDSSSPVVIPTGTNDASTAAITDNFFIGETEMTYGLWYEVLVWSTNNNAAGGTRVDGGPLYKFYSSGREGNDGTASAAPTDNKNEPVTFISWCDAVVWCNYFRHLQQSRHISDSVSREQSNWLTGKLKITENKYESRFCPYSAGIYIRRKNAHYHF